MGTGYTRQSAADIVDGLPITAAPLNNEFNAIKDAFDATTGHSHDGTSGEGPKIVLTAAANVAGILPIANGGTGGTTQGTAQTALGLGSMSTQNANAVAITGGTVSGLTTLGASAAAITGGTITGITDLAVADGGTGASTAAVARTNLGVAIGTDVQAQNAALSSIAGLTTAANQTVYTTGSNAYATTSLTPYARTALAAVDAAAARTVLGEGTISTQNANAVAITGGSITGITDLLVADGGTGASTDGAARTNLSTVGVLRQSGFSTSGTYTPHPNMIFCIVELLGGGGGGGSQTGVLNQTLSAGGGGSGGYTRAGFTKAQIGVSQAITIGAGGAGGTAGGSGGPGGTTSLGSLANAMGGTGGGTNGVPGAGAVVGSIAAGLRYPGNPGSTGQFLNSTQGVGFGSSGGSAFFGGGATAVFASPGGAATGNNGQSSGCGGGGGAVVNLVASPAGGIGAPGSVTVLEFCSE